MLEATDDRRMTDRRVESRLIGGIINLHRLTGEIIYDRKLLTRLSWCNNVSDVHGRIKMKVGLVSS